MLPTRQPRLTTTDACPSSCAVKRMLLSVICTSYPINHWPSAPSVAIHASGWRTCPICACRSTAAQLAIKASTVCRKLHFRVTGACTSGPITDSTSWRDGLCPISPRRWVFPPALRGAGLNLAVRSWLKSFQRCTAGGLRDKIEPTWSRRHILRPRPRRSLVGWSIY